MDKERLRRWGVYFFLVLGVVCGFFCVWGVLGTWFRFFSGGVQVWSFFFFRRVWEGKGEEEEKTRSAGVSAV